MLEAPYGSTRHGVWEFDGPGGRQETSVWMSGGGRFLQIVREVVDTTGARHVTIVPFEVGEETDNLLRAIAVAVECAPSEGAR